MSQPNINLKSGEKPVVVAGNQAPVICANVDEANKLAADKRKILTEQGRSADSVVVKQQING